MTQTPFSDILKLLNLSLFAFSNGFLQTICACWAPGEAAPEHQENVGYSINLTLNTGILLGSLVQLIFATVKPANGERH